jgi:5-formyltetrahydrofolate cyclo-ligase
VTPDIDDEKQRLRAEAKRRRAAAAAAAGGAGAALCRRLISALDDGSIPLAPGAAVSAYWPKGDELDPRPAMAALAARGHPIGLPVVAGRGAPLMFRRWAPGDRLEPAGFGLSEPAGAAARASATAAASTTGPWPGSATRAARSPWASPMPARRCPPCPRVPATGRSTGS